jgi:hypothetical protein
MPTIVLYVNDYIYSKIEKYSMLWDKSIGKTAALIIEKGVSVLEREYQKCKREGVTE